MKPILKWAGGKRWLVPLLKEAWEPYSQTTLVEPFTGGLAVALGLNPQKALLSDANLHLINFYQQIKKGLQIKVVLENNADFYYEMRSQFNDMIHRNQFRNKKAASLFYFLIRTGFNGLCRFNQSGLFNVPFGQHRTINYQYDFREYQSVLEQWDFCSGDFEALKLKGSEFLYVDPPYDVEFTNYHGSSFRWEDQIRLGEWLNYHRGPIVASNQATARILKLYKALGFTIFTLPAPRSIACNGDRRPAIEMLACKGIDSGVMKKLKKILKAQS